MIYSVQATVDAVVESRVCEVVHLRTYLFPPKSAAIPILTQTLMIVWSSVRHFRLQQAAGNRASKLRIVCGCLIRCKNSATDTQYALNPTLGLHVSCVTAE